MAASRFHLLQRGKHFYFRLRVPIDLQRWIGRKELRRSLKTARYPDAKALVRVGLYRAAVRKIRGGIMDAQQIKRLVAGYFENVLQGAEDARADGIGVLIESEDGAEELTRRRGSTSI